MQIRRKQRRTGGTFNAIAKDTNETSSIDHAVPVYSLETRKIESSTKYICMYR